MFHLMCVHVIVGSVRVTEWPPFGNKLLTPLTMFSLYLDYLQV